MSNEYTTTEGTADEPIFWTGTIFKMSQILAARVPSFAIAVSKKWLLDISDIPVEVVGPFAVVERPSEAADSIYVRGNTWKDARESVNRVEAWLAEQTRL